MPSDSVGVSSSERPGDAATFTDDITAGVADADGGRVTLVDRFGGDTTTGDAAGEDSNDGPTTNGFDALRGVSGANSCDCWSFSGCCALDSCLRCFTLRRTSAMLLN